ncbi:MAG: hypothetical protein U0670_24730 [Anaerolineae bacterium]
MKKHRLAGIVVGLALLVSLSLVHAQASDHPRLWVRAADLELYRSWANESNPLWVALNGLAEEARGEMDAGNVPARDGGSVTWEEYPTENYAMLFAFLSLIDPDEAARADYAARAHSLLMSVIDQAVLGTADAPFRSSEFSISDRSRWNGLGFPLTVDWIYDTLTAQDKAAIHTVFSRWCEENRQAYTTNNNHPEPIGVRNDPSLLADREYIRWSSNNYYAAHMRNMGMMAISFDAADDPDGALATCLDDATGAWLYVTDYVQRTDTRGGMGAEGFEYSPQTNGYDAQFLLALFTAGKADPERRGPQVEFAGNPYWDDAVTAYIHSLSPRPVEFDWRGEAYQPAWYGSGQNYLMPDPIELFGPLAIYDRLSGNAPRLDRLRWLQTVTPIGGANGLTARMDVEQFHIPILYFLMFDPTVPLSEVDPRTGMETTYYAPGMRRLLSRPDWSPDATWFTYSASWQTIDHQTGNANAIEFYRQGEWLTKVRVGYDLDYQTSDNQNSVTIFNGLPNRDASDYRTMLGQRGSQWLYVAAGDPAEPIIRRGDNYLAVYGDATNVYNSTYEELTHVQHASRSVVWLQPDVMVIYDRAVTDDSGAKDFWLNLPANATIDGNTTTMISPGGQTLQITALLPAAITLEVQELTDEPSGAPAVGETMRYRYHASAAGDPADVSFLHVLWAGDPGAEPPLVRLVSTDPLAPIVEIGSMAVSLHEDQVSVEGSR